MADPVTIADIYALFQASQAEADRRLERLERVATNTSREVAGLTTRWGQFVENLVAPSVIRLFQERGIEVQEISRRMQSQRPGAEMAIDIFAVNGDVAVEVKSRLSRQDVDDFLARLGRFRQAFPHYTGYQIHGAVAGIEIDEGVIAMPINRGCLRSSRQGIRWRSRMTPPFNQ
jgi:hypothetical protein